MICQLPSAISLCQQQMAKLAVLGKARRPCFAAQESVGCEAADVLLFFRMANFNFILTHLMKIFQTFASEVFFALAFQAFLRRWHVKLTGPVFTRLKHQIETGLHLPTLF